MHISTWSIARNARWLFFLRVHLWEPNGGYTPLNLQNVQIQICDIVTVTLCPLHAMERDESGSLHGGSTEAGVEYLTPTKSFAKKRVTAGAAIVGEIRGSPEASLALQKAATDFEREAWSADGFSDPTILCKGVSEDELSTAVAVEEVTHFRRMAEFARVCQQACAESKHEWACEEEHRARAGGESESQSLRRLDGTRLQLGMGNEYLLGALIRIGRHLGLSGQGTRQGKGRKQEEGNLLAVAALQYLVSGMFLSPDTRVAEQSAGESTGRASVYDRVPSHVSRDIFDKDELLRRRLRCDSALDEAVHQCCAVHHI